MGQISHSIVRGRDAPNTILGKDGDDRVGDATEEEGKDELDRLRCPESAP